MTPVVRVVVDLVRLSHGFQIGGFALHSVIVGVIDKITIPQGANGVSPFRCPDEGISASMLAKGCHSRRECKAVSLMHSLALISGCRHCTHSTGLSSTSFCPALSHL
jgi:hypothetical protein